MSDIARVAARRGERVSRRMLRVGLVAVEGGLPAIVIGYLWCWPARVFARWRKKADVKVSVWSKNVDGASECCDCKVAFTKQTSLTRPDQ